MRAFASSTANRTPSTGSSRSSAASNDSRKIAIEAPSWSIIEYARPRVSAQPRECARPLFRADGLLERVHEEPAGLLALVEPHRDLGFEQAARVVAPLRAGCQVVLAHAQTAPHLAEELEGGNPVARLDSRDVRRRAALERELALAQAGALTRFFESATDLYGVVDMG